MKNSFIIVLFLVSMVLVPSVLADGGAYITYGEEGWVPANQTLQLGIIDYKDGKEELTITINAELNGSRGVWIFPIPAKPEQITVDIVKKIPKFSGYDVRSRVGYEIYKLYPLMMFSQVYTTPYVYVMEVYTAGGGGYEGYREDTGVTIHGHLERAGLITELVTTEDENKLNDYLKEKNLNLPQQSLSLIKDYIGKDYSFVVSWISDIEKYKQETGGNTLGVKTIFPTDELYYPLKLTSIYGNRAVPIFIYVFGHVSPNIYRGIKGKTKIDYYAGNVRYTKIRINSLANSLTRDLWISRRTPVDILFTDLILINPIVFMIIIFATCSIAASIISGHFVFKGSVSLKKFIFLGLCNFFTLLGFLIAVYLIIKEKGKKINRLLVGVFVLTILTLLLSIYFMYSIISNAIIVLFLVTLLSSIVLGLIILAKIGPKRLLYVIAFSITFLLLLWTFCSKIIAVYSYKSYTWKTIFYIEDTECTNSGITVWVRNYGRDLENVRVDVDGYTCSIPELLNGETWSCTTSGRPASGGYYTVKVSTVGWVDRGSVYCPQ